MYFCSMVLPPQGDSGGMLDHVVRFSEQLVLCAKAATVIRDGIRQYNIGNALTSSDPSDTHKTGKTCFFWSSVVFMLVFS